MNVSDMNRDELRAEAKRLDIAGRGKMLRAELEQSIRERTEVTRAEVEQALADLVVETDIAPLTRALNIQAKAIRLRMRRGQRGLLPTGEVMPLHHRGRAIGAKHVNLRVAAQRDRREFFALTVPAGTAQTEEVSA